MQKLISSIILTFIFGFCFGQAPMNIENPTDQNKLLFLLEEIANLDDHCEVPCGIYGDSLRIALMYEHTSTIEKAMAQVNELSGAGSINYNQIVRWVMNKEKHAEEIQYIVSQYFMHQRIKMPAADASDADNKKYAQQLKALHSISVYAMKTKQSTDDSYVVSLKNAIHTFEHAYFGDGSHKH